MKIMSWNVRGLSGFEKRRLVREAIMKSSPSVVILQETKKDSINNRLVKWTMGALLSKWCVIPSCGLIGAILCAWNPCKVCKVKEIIGNFSISIILKDIALGCEWMLTRVYGPTNTTNRDAFWEELLEVRERWSVPWVVGGNFNVIRFVHKKSSRVRITRSMRDFDDSVRNGNLRYCLLANAKYTWTNGQEAPIFY